MKCLARLPSRVLYLLPRVLLLALFLTYVTFMLLSSYEWFRPVEVAVQGAVAKLVRGTAGLWSRL
ncbi:hypothetical protein [Geobacter sulfurreducens]|uniref:hypothetical protein n=1 Tax=Geobacter sulfurreducens TaxID=35554 RepID=UPI002CB7A31A|nr:hypothetical protein [Geobacter sulfurreducens]HML78523.1 hypothetical protein [Geobacter sulfurreducens]